MCTREREGEREQESVMTGEVMTLSWMIAVGGTVTEERDYRETERVSSRSRHNV